jgi:hypothetical protein
MAQRRRSRFTATARDGSKHVVLAYSTMDARRFYEKRGVDVVTVVRGDYRMAARTPSAPSNPQWRKNTCAILDAIEFLGLTKPVTIKVTTRRGGRQGAHQLRGVDSTPRFFSRGAVSDFARAADVGHYITIKSWLDPKRAGEVIWHELCHAMQAEEVMRALPATCGPMQQYHAWALHESQGKGVTYMRKPVEVEAREYERFNDEMPLAV